MNFFYNIAIQISKPILKVVALFNPKIKQGVHGRSETFDILKGKIKPNEKTLWFHCASLGEYEQGLPVFKELRELYSNHKIVLSFFSPSGYEIRKNASIADVVVYLPLDTKRNAIRFLDIVNPELTIFVKYDIWPTILIELKKRKLRAILISALFRKEQAFFKFYGNNMRKALFAFEHVFVQNESSKTLLNTINYNQITVSGDTRFDRVFSQLKQDNTLQFIENFKQNNLCIVAGSTWLEDEELFINYINSNNPETEKFIIAPHNIKREQIVNLKKKLRTKVVLFSEKDDNTISNFNVLIIDTIGLLSKIYSYADIAYVGGAVGTTGLHNTLEPAVFGIPIIIGNNYTNFPEALAMIKNKGMCSVKNQNEFNSTLNSFLKNANKRLNSGTTNSAYIKKNTGAVIQIMDFIRK